MTDWIVAPGAVGARKTIDAVIADLDALAADLHGTADAVPAHGDDVASAAAGVELAVTSLRHIAQELAAWRRKAQAGLHVGSSAAASERHAADKSLRALGVDPTRLPGPTDLVERS